MAKKEADEEKAKPEAGEGDTENGEAGAGESPKKGKKKLIIIIAAVLVLVIVGVVFMLMSGGDKKEEEAAADEHAAAEVAKPVYYELPEFLVNLSSNSNRVSFLKMSVTLELKNQESVATVEANKPRILDTFNTYLRELRPQDVQGSAGIYRLKDELISRVNGTVEEGLVKDILFSEIIIQ